jgi:peroxiredoxin
VIDPEGRVRKVFENVSPGGHGTEVLDYLRHELSSN